MAPSPVFASLEAYRARQADTGFWQPHVAEVLARHGLPGDPAAMRPGIGATYPTFLCGDLVVKLFGGWPTWRQSFSAESAVQVVLARDPGLLVPASVAEGTLFAESPDAWPYLVTARVAGLSWDRAELSDRQRIAVAAQLGEQVARLHRLPPPDLPAWATLDLEEACGRSALPSHLVADVEAFVARTGEGAPVLVHGDLMERHAFVEHGRLTGIIDWGDAMVADPHYELAKLHLGLFAGDGLLLRAFLSAANWAVGPDFARRCLAQAIRRQAVGLVQHPSMDVSHRVPDLLQGRVPATLDELAGHLFPL